MKKRICFIDFDMSVRGGVEQVTSSLSAELSEKYDVYVLSLIFTEGKLAYELAPGVHFSFLQRSSSRLRVLRKELKPLLKRYLSENKIDIAFLQGNYSGFIATTLRNGTNIKLIFCDHGDLISQWKQKQITTIRFIASLLSHRVVTLTKSNQEDYIRKFHLPRRKISNIYNWVSPDQVYSKHYCRNSRKIIAAGRMEEEKGFDLLLSAFSVVVEKHPDWHLDLWGDGVLWDDLHRLTEELQLNENVRFMGMRSDIFEHYGDYAMFMLSSHREGFSLVLSEAKANRLPLVSFDVVSGPREIIRDGIDGILVPPEDIAGLSDAMLRLIEDDELRVEMSNHSQENLDKFSKEKILAQWISLIESFDS